MCHDRCGADSLWVVFLTEMERVIRTEATPSLVGEVGRKGPDQPGKTLGLTKACPRVARHTGMWLTRRGTLNEIGSESVAIEVPSILYTSLGLWGCSP